MIRRLVFVLSLMIFVFTLSTATPTPALAQDQPAAEGQTIHVVQRGENLYRISLRYNVSIAAIQAANNIPNPNLIFAGQQLIIPSGAQPPTPPTPPTPTPSPDVPSTYTVVRGDTLAAIARRFGTTFQALAAANGIANPNLIFAGQVLNIPGGTGPTPDPGDPQPTAPPPPVDPPPMTGGFELGGHVQDFRFPDLMRNTGMTWVKKQLVWQQGQPPSVAQGFIDQARANGFKLLLGITGDPGQLGSNRQQYIQEYATFVGQVAELGVDAIEVWNEPNIDRQWPAGQISGAAYTEMLRAAYNAIKAANPNTMVISGAPAPTGAESAFPGRVVNDDRFIREMAAAGAANYMDCVGIHYNEGILPPTARSGDPRGNGTHYSRYYPTMVSLYSGTFPSRPLCFTEIGYLSPEGYGPLPPNFAWAGSVTAQQQAEWLGQAVTLARNSGQVRLFIIWNVDFTNYGDDPQAGYAIVRPDGQCRACAVIRAALGN